MSDCFSQIVLQDYKKKGEITAQLWYNHDNSVNQATIITKDSTISFFLNDCSTYIIDYLDSNYVAYKTHCGTGGVETFGEIQYSFVIIKDAPKLNKYTYVRGFYPEKHLVVLFDETVTKLNVIDIFTNDVILSIPMFCEATHLGIRVIERITFKDDTMSVALQGLLHSEHESYLLKKYKIGKTYHFKLPISLQ